MKKHLLWSAFWLLFLLPAFSQNIAINADGAHPDPNAILDIQSGTKGLLIPRMGSAARTQIPNTRGLLVFDTTTNTVWYNTGTAWQNLLVSAQALSTPDSAWLLTGNTTTAASFLGTINNVPLNIRVNNQPAGHIDSSKENTFWGYFTGVENPTGTDNMGVGAFALQSTQGGSYNTASGARALISNTAGNNNTSSGFQSMFNNITGSFNTAIGVQALYANTYGSGLTATGYQALYHDDVPQGAEGGDGFGNTANGYQSLFSSTVGYNNTAMGYQSLYLNVSGTTNAAVGYQAMYSNTSGGGNTAFGYSCMYSNTTGLGNTASGYGALSANTTGQFNTASGSNTMGFNTSGNENTATGIMALWANTTGNGNTGTGRGALTTNISGTWNTGNGYSALYYNTIGNYNTADGAQSLAFNTSGIENVAAGYLSLYTNTTGSDNTAIGASADVSTGGLTNATALGFGAIVDASNKVRIGNSAVTVIEGQVPFTTPSDGRFKFNVQENVKGLDFILKLRPVTYQFDVQRFDARLSHQSGQNSYALPASYDEATRIRRTGFIAQEVEKAADAAGYDFSGIIRPKTDDDHYSLSYESFVVPLVKAVQEQHQIILEQDRKIADLQKQIDEIKKLVQK
jgi:hypothetical protein